MHTITGPHNVKVGDTSTYTVSPADGTSYVWILTGATIISGQGTSSVTVTWTSIDTTKVQVNVSLVGGGQDVIIIDPNSQG